MPTLTKEFKTSSRNEIVALCDEIAELIRRELHVNFDRKEPIIIGVTGGTQSGKSLFWDRIREQLLGGNGVFLSDHSVSNESLGRCLEKWVTPFNQKPKTVFFCNIHSLFIPEYVNDEIAYDPLQELYGRKRNELGDVIILTNIHHNFLSADKYDIMIDIQFSKNPETDWDRNLKFSVDETSPFTPLVI